VHPSSSNHKLTPEDFDNADVIWLLHHCGDVKFENANDAQQIEIVTPRKLSFVVVVISVEEHLAAPPKLGETAQLWQIN
jgi:hypothetical protein